MAKYLAILLIVFVLTGCSLKSAAQPTLPTVNLSVANSQLLVELADEPSEQYQGLSNRTSLSAGQGMLFTFSDSNYQTFVMRDMKFPLDLVWINKGKIVGFNNNLPPADESRLENYQSPVPCDWVLEVPAGTVSTSAWQLGNEVKIN